MPTYRLVFPEKEPADVLDYQIDATAKIADMADTISSASVAVAPSGLGEMVASRIAVNGSFITIWLAGGMPARVYQIDVQVMTTGQRTYEWTAVVPINSDLATYPITPPASAGFGMPVTWSL